MLRKKIKKIPVEEFTSYSPLFVSPETTLTEIVEIMRENGFRHLPVVENKTAIGVISDRDVAYAFMMNSEACCLAKDIMTKDPYTVLPSASLEEVVFELSNRKINSAIVSDKSNNLFGIFTSTDALNALVEVLRGKEFE